MFWTAIEELLLQELQKPLDTIFKTINHEPIVADSIGKIHRGTFINGTEVAIKIQRPGIDKIVAQDIALIQEIAKLVSLTEFGQNYNFVKLTDEFTQSIKSELNFT